MAGQGQDRLSADEVRRVLARAAELDVDQRGHLPIEAVAEAALEAGVSEHAVQRAVAESAAMASLPEVPDAAGVVVERQLSAEPAAVQRRLQAVLGEASLAQVRSTASASLWVPAPRVRSRSRSVQRSSALSLWGVDWVRTLVVAAPEDTTAVRIEIGLGRTAGRSAQLERRTILVGGGLTFAGIGAGVAGLVAGIDAGDIIPFGASGLVAALSTRRLRRTRNRRQRGAWRLRTNVEGILDRVEHPPAAADDDA